MAATVILVDDEPAALRRLRHLLARHSDLEVVGEYMNVAAARHAMREAAPDLVLLDVQMPADDGFSLLEGIPADKVPAVIFVTAHDRHAVRAFDVDAIDFVLKPVDEARFDLALQRARQVIESRSNQAINDRLRQLIGNREVAPAPDPPSTRLAVRQAGSVSFLPVAEIDWIDAAHNQCRLHAGGKTYLLRESISDVERRLDPQVFQRIHRSTVVNLDRVRELRVSDSGQYLLVLHGGQRLTVSRSHREKIRERLGMGS